MTESLSFKPATYNSLSPYLIVAGAQQLIDMLVAVFDARPLRRYDRSNGQIMHGEVQLDDSILMIADATDAYPAYPMWLHVYVVNVDETFAKALQHGCQLVEPPTEREGDPDRRGTFTDFAGNHWSIATQIELKD
ncbi:VOC family protein [Spirosoma koreense]